MSIHFYIRGFMQQQNLSDGHRGRLREKFMETGSRSLTKSNLIELLLFYSVKRADTKPVASRIVNHYGGSFERLFCASAAELEKIEGVGANSAELIALAGKILRAINKCGEVEFTLPENPNLLELKSFAASLYKNESRPRMDLALLDNNARLFNVVRITDGFCSASEIQNRELVDCSLLNGASCAVLTLYRTRSNYYPGEEDIELLKYVKAALEKFNISLRDFIIVTKNATFSLSADFDYCDYF